MIKRAIGVFSDSSDDEQLTEQQTKKLQKEFIPGAYETDSEQSELEEDSGQESGNEDSSIGEELGSDKRSKPEQDDFRGKFRCELCPNKILIFEKDVEIHIQSAAHKKKEAKFLELKEGGAEAIKAFEAKVMAKVRQKNMTEEEQQEAEKEKLDRKRERRRKKQQKKREMQKKQKSQTDDKENPKKEDHSTEQVALKKEMKKDGASGQMDKEKADRKYAKYLRKQERRQQSGKRPAKEATIMNLETAEDCSAKVSTKTLSISKFSTRANTISSAAEGVETTEVDNNVRRKKKVKAQQSADACPTSVLVEATSGAASALATSTADPEGSMATVSPKRKKKKKRDAKQGCISQADSGAMDPASAEDANDGARREKKRSKKDKLAEIERLLA